MKAQGRRPRRDPSFLPSLHVWLILSVLYWIPIVTPAYAADIDLLQSAIKEKNARWVAGETSVSGLTLEEKRKLASAPIPFESETGRLEESRTSLVPVPLQFDLRNIAGRNFVTPVRDQRTCGSCWAFAVVGAVESKILQALSRPGTDFDLSEQVLVSCDTRNKGCEGGDVTPASDFVRDNGLPLESCFPYTSIKDPCANACPQWGASAYRVTGYHSVDRSAQSLKEAVYESGAVACLMIVYDDFFAYKSGIYTHVSGDRIGGHAVVVTGYNDAEEYFIAKNSWGTQWGELGFFNIAYSEVTGSSSFGSGCVAYDSLSMPGPAFAIAPSVLVFGVLFLPAETEKKMTIAAANIGNTPLANISLSVDGPNFSVAPTLIPFLDVGSSAEVIVTYTAGQNAGDHSGTLTASTGSTTRSIALIASTNTKPPDSNNTPAPASASSGGSGGGGCLIATAAYGTDLAPQVLVLKDFRDKRLLSSSVGRWFVDAYYRYSPPVADFIAGNLVARTVTRSVLVVLVFAINHPTGVGAIIVLCCTASALLMRRNKR